MRPLHLKELPRSIHLTYHNTIFANLRSPSDLCRLSIITMPQMDDRCLFPPPYDKAYGRSVNTLISDSNILTPDLHQRALNLLSVLDQPAYSAYNRPSWIDQLTSDEHPRPSSCTFTARRMVDAMYAAADDLGLEAGARYVSAAVCASAIHEPSGADEQLALRLSRLAFTWTAYMLWPCKPSHSSCCAHVLTPGVVYADLWAARSEQCGCGSDTCDSSNCPEQERHERIELDVRSLRFSLCAFRLLTYHLRVHHSSG